MTSGSANFTRKKLLISIAILVPLAYFLRLNSYQLIFEEPRRALVALEMLLVDNWLIPTTNGELYYNKPPLYNWVLIGFFSLLGKAEWVVRFPSVLSVLATAAIHYRISKIYIGKQAALFSALFYITSADILFYFSLLGEIDLFFALLVYLQCVLIFHFYQQKKFHWLFILSYLLTAAGVLTKGIPSLFFQAITILLIFFLNKDYKRLFSIWHFAGIAVLVLTAGAYFYVYSLQYDVGPYLARLFTETFSRTALERSTSDSLMHLLNFPVMLIKISAPWFLLFLLTINTGWKQRLRSNPFLKFCLWFCLANGILYLLSPGTRERYLYMFFPFIYSLLAAAFTGKQEGTGLNRIRQFYFFIGISVSAGLFGLGVFGLVRYAWADAVACFLLGSSVAAGLYYVKFRTSAEWILASVMIILIARIGFDLIILPTKKQNDTYKADALAMSQITADQAVYLIGPPDQKTDKVQFAGRHFISYHRNEPTYLAFQTSFYLSRFTGKILKYTESESKKGFYISMQKYTDPDRIKVFYRFNNRLNKEDQWYVLYKYKNQ